MKSFKLEDSIESLKQVGPKIKQKLEKAGIFTIGDLIFFFPRTFQDFSQIVPLKDLKIGESAPVVAKVQAVKLIKTPKKKLIIVEALISDGTKTLRVLWFNQPFVYKKLKKGEEYGFVGKLVKSKFGLHLSSPLFAPIQQAPDWLGKIVPVYTEIQGLPSRFISQLIRQALANLDLNELKEFLPDFVLKASRYPEIKQAIFWVHFPENLEKAKQAQERFIFQELFIHQLALLLEKKGIKSYPAPLVSPNPESIQLFLEQFPFSLTQNQLKVLEEIFNDLKSGKPMNRLLQGETGAGKTLIAELSSLVVAENGFQVILMAPTEILANQHFERFVEHFKKFPFRIGLLTKSGGKVGFQGFKIAKKKNEVLESITTKQIDIVIGTQALIQEKVRFRKVGLIVIDEQQRFGVAQRQQLIIRSQKENKEGSNFIPHFLSMTATPIPRTLALAFYSDLDLSILEERPFGRKPVKIFVALPNKKQKIWEFLKKEIDKGHQGMIICPRVEMDEKNEEVRAVKKVFQEIKEIFSQYQVEMLHGKMKDEEKNLIMEKMLEEKIQILVASSVVEVGIDLPKITVVVIEGAEKFGFAQLYQLAGRAGRSQLQGYAFLIPSVITKSILKRLYLVKNAKNALELAEKDLQWRGAGEFAGVRQAGMPDLVMKALKNKKLVEQAKVLGEKTLTLSPDLKNFPLLKKIIDSKRARLY